MESACQRLLDALAESLVLADATDEESLAEVQRLLDELMEACLATDSGELGDALFAAVLAFQDLEVEGGAARALEKASQVALLAQGGARDPAPDRAGDALVLPEWVDEAVFSEFLASQQLGLEDLEALILNAEAGDLESVPELKRRLHTLKGEAGVLGLVELEALCHKLETRMEEAGEDQPPIELLLGFHRWLEAGIQSWSQGNHLQEGVQGFFARMDTQDEPEPEPEPEPVEDPSLEGGQAPGWDEEILGLVGEFLGECEEGLSQADDLLLDIREGGGTRDQVDALFRVFHTIKGVAGFLDFGEITEAAHVTETLLNQVREGQRSLVGESLDICFDATGLVRRQAEEIQRAVAQGGMPGTDARYESFLAHIHELLDGTPPATAPAQAPPAAVEEYDDDLDLDLQEPRLGQVLERVGVSSEHVVDALVAQRHSGRPLGEELVAQGKASEVQIQQGLRAQEAVRSKLKTMVKVDLERIDSLVEMVGELVIVESMITGSNNIRAHASMRDRQHLAQLAKITRDVQRLGMQLRMIPLRGVFQKMARMVRDLSTKSGKSIRFERTGETTEMDRNMVERIGDPLVHMIRNAVDHGIEDDPEERVRLGKPAQGTVRLSAFHEGGNIVIEIADDGKGLDRGRILAKAISKGLAREGQELTDNEIYNLIFAPGFSTAAQVTSISGRGVGMDVVKRGIESMRGRVLIDSVQGEGTTFKMVLPLTLAIIDGMLVRCGSEHYIVPVLAIEESFQPAPGMVVSFGGEPRLLHFRGATLPLVPLHALFDIDGAHSDPTKALVIVIEGAEQKLALMVDDVVTQQQVVIKSLGGSVDSPYVSGATILSDGTVGLILNVEDLGTMVASGGPPRLRRGASFNQDRPQGVEKSP